MAIAEKKLWFRKLILPFESRPINTVADTGVTYALATFPARDANM